jgi:hypothetical protein
MKCRAGYRSEAVYILSQDAMLSQGTGAVQSLALTSAFSKLLSRHLHVVFAVFVFIRMSHQHQFPAIIKDQTL